MARRRQRDGWDGEERRQAPLVLVAGDDAGTRELLARVLVQTGLRAVQASTVEGALGAAVEQLPRCVVIDLSSKGVGSSMQLLDGLRNHEDDRVRSTRVVVVARSDANRNYSFQSGADGFLQRPFHGRELLDVVAEVLAVPPDQRAVHRRAQLR